LYDHRKLVVSRKKSIEYGLLDAHCRPASKQGKYGQVKRPISTGKLNTLGKPLALTHPAYQRGGLPRVFRENSSWGWLLAYMLSAIILSRLSYPAVPLARQLVH